MDKAWLKTRIAATKTQIETLETAAANLAAGSIESYSFDTGQTKQSVTKSNIATLERTIDSLYSRLDVLNARVYGSGVTVRPDW